MAGGVRGDGGRPEGGEGRGGGEGVGPLHLPHRLVEVELGHLRERAPSVVARARKAMVGGEGGGINERRSMLRPFGLIDRGGFRLKNRSGC
jgi:hypothetical protein